MNFWAELYAPHVPGFAREAPFTSKDIDFCGDARAVRICAERLGEASRIPTMDDHTPNSGVVTFVDDSTAALKQLRVSVVCAREFIRYLITTGHVREASKLNERIFQFVLKDRHGKEVHATHGVDPFDAVVVDDDRLPARFRETRYPQMQRELETRRARSRR